VSNYILIFPPADFLEVNDGAVNNGGNQEKNKTFESTYTMDDFDADEE
jgi:hypothetical protein